MDFASDAARRRLLSERARGHYFFLDLAQRTGGPLAVAFGGREECAANYLVQRVTYPFPTLEYVAEGTGMIAIGDGADVPMGAGTCFAYGPGVPIRMAGTGNPMTKYFICLTGREAWERLNRPVELFGRMLRLHAHAEIRESFDLLIREGRESRPGAGALCLNLFQRLLLKVDQACASSTLVVDRHREAFLRVKSLIDADPVKFSSIGNLCKESGLSRTWLFRLFKAHLDTTPYRYVLRQKMNLAARDLFSSDCMIKEVAQRAGFDDPLHFSRIFRSVHGLSPSKWRRSHHGSSSNLEAKAKVQRGPLQQRWMPGESPTK